MVTRVAKNISLSSRQSVEHYNSSVAISSRSRVVGVIMAGRDPRPHQKHRKWSTKATNRIFWTRREGRAIICILILSVKIVGSAGNAIRNNDQGTIINGNSSIGIGDLSISRGQQQPNLGQVNQTERRFATDANDVTRRTGGGGDGDGVVGGVSERISVVVGSALGRAATYSYFYIGRKLMYVPLFFLVYWTIYNMALLLQSIASRWVSELSVPVKMRFGLSHGCVVKNIFNHSTTDLWEQEMRNLSVRETAHKIIFIFPLYLSDSSTCPNIGPQHHMQRKKRRGRGEHWPLIRRILHEMDIIMEQSQIITFRLLVQFWGL